MSKHKIWKIIASVLIAAMYVLIYLYVFEYRKAEEIELNRDLLSIAPESMSTLIALGLTCEFVVFSLVGLAYAFIIWYLPLDLMGCEKE